MVRVRKSLSFLMCVSVLLGFLACMPTCGLSGTETGISDPVSPVIQDFYVNNTWVGQSCQFSFNVTDSVALDHAVFGCNVTQNFVNDSAITLSGKQAWANCTHTLPSLSCTVSFQLWVWNTNSSIATTGLRYMKVYAYDSNAPYVSLVNAIKSVDSANNWATVEPYAQTVLAKKTTTDLEIMIDDYANADDWVDTLKWSAICNKLWYSSIPSDVRSDIINALGNYSMVGSLPFTQNGGTGSPSFCTENQWALYGYYYAVQYNVDLAKWNVTAAYQQFNSSVDYSVTYTDGLPLWVYSNGKATTFTDRYYDEDADTVECYILFAQLLNVPGAMNDALRWWSYDDSKHWDNTNEYYWYTPTSPIYECEAPFFLKIISELKYYAPSMSDWPRVLTDIANRYLAQEWNSPQWGGVNVVVHANPGNPQRRLENTLGAWQALSGVFLQLNSTYQNSVKDMLSGNNAIEPAWRLLLTPQAELYTSSSQLFHWYDGYADDNTATAYAEILLFLMGIVPGSTTIAFPLEELNYEYIQDIDPQMLQFSLRTQTITVPVSNAGSMTFQYGVSPVTCVFNQSGIWQVKFSNSWNMITKATFISALPTSHIYFGQAYSPPVLYEATIKAHCITEGADVYVQIAMDGSPTDHTTPYTFSALKGTHTFTVPNNDTAGDPFKLWSTGQTVTNITVSSDGTYEAYYGLSPVHDVALTSIAPPKTVVGQNYGINISVTVQNLGDFLQTFNVTLYANTTAIGNVTVTNLPNVTFALITFVWNTSGYSYGNYSISAHAWPVSGETDTNGQHPC